MQGIKSLKVILNYKTTSDYSFITFCLKNNNETMVGGNESKIIRLPTYQLKINDKKPYACKHLAIWETEETEVLFFFVSIVLFHFTISICSESSPFKL